MIYIAQHDPETSLIPINVSKSHGTSASTFENWEVET